MACAFCNRIATSRISKSFSGWKKQRTGYQRNGHLAAPPIKLELPFEASQLAGWTARGEIGILKPAPSTSGIYKIAVTGGRLDFFFAPPGVDFDCTNDDLSTCDYRLVARDGIYDRKTDRVSFEPGSVLLDFQGVQVKDGTAGFEIAFFPIDGGGEEPTGPEKGPDLCCDGEDNDGDGLIDEDDPNCKKVVCE